jgi:hypothetical protein
LTFLKKIPDQTENIVIIAAGIDMFILGTTAWSSREIKYGEEKRIRENNERYVREIVKELTRVLGKGSQYYSYHSAINTEHLFVS